MGYESKKTKNLGMAEDKELECREHSRYRYQKRPNKAFISVVQGRFTRESFAGRVVLARGWHTW